MTKKSNLFVLGIVISLTTGVQVFAGNNAATASVKERYETAKQIAVYHSAGLEYVFNVFKKDGKLLQEVVSNKDEKQTAEVVLKVIVSHVSKSDVSAALERLSKNFPTQDAGNFKNTTMPKSVVYFDKVVDNIRDESLYEDAFAKAMDSKEFTAFSEPEQNDILLMFAIYADSYQYWTGNLNNWSNLTVSVLPPSDKPLIESNLKKFSWRNVGKADAAGAIGGAVGGAIGGAIAGSAVGGVGAIPGAIGGALAGAVSVGAGTSVTYALFQIFGL